MIAAADEAQPDREWVDVGDVSLRTQGAPFSRSALNSILLETCSLIFVDVRPSSGVSARSKAMRWGRDDDEQGR